MERRRAVCCIERMNAQADPEKGVAQRDGRLFSNLDRSLRHEKGSVLGASILIAGTTVGAGILALPYTTQEAGFVPSTAALAGVYVFSIVTGLLLAEANINLMCELGQGGVSITSIAKATLGEAGARLSSGAYLFLHYALLVAYTAKTGEILGQAVLDVPPLMCSAVFCGGLAGLCYFLEPDQLDKANGGLLAAVLLSFVALLWSTAGAVRVDNLVHSDWLAVPQTLGVLSLAFVFQNIVPVVCSRLEGDIVKVRQAIVAGVTVPLLMFVTWNGAILGSQEWLGPGHDRADPLALLSQQSPNVGPLIQVFSLLAVATSYIGFVLGLTDFLSDMMKLPVGRQQPLPYLLSIIPPFILAGLFPDLFFQALDVAGTYGVLSLFGILPAASAWSQRYGKDSSFAGIRAVPGEKAMVIMVGCAAGGVILNQAVTSLWGGRG